MVKSKTPEEFFSTFVGKKIWQKGITMAGEMSRQRGVMPDGMHQVRVRNAFLDASSRGRAYQILVFEKPEDPSITISKAIAIDHAEGLAHALLDLSVFTSKIDRPRSLTQIYEDLGQSNPLVIIDIKTNGRTRDIEVISMLNFIQKVEPPVLKDEPPVVKPALQKLMNEPTVLEQPSLPPVEAAPPPKGPEVDIAPGQRLIVKILGDDHEAVIVRLYEEEREIAVQLADGSKHLISADTDVVKFLG